jgi:MscS family membrane protein
MEESAIMQRVFWGNPVGNYVWCLGILLVGILFRQLISKGLSWLAYKLFNNYASEDVGFKKFLELLRKPFSFFIALVTIYFAFSQLNFPIHWNIGPIEKWGLRMFLMRVMQTFIVVSFTWIILRIIDFGGIIFLQKALKTESKTDDQIIPFVKESIKILVMIFSLFTVLGAVYNLDITSLIAGLGIGGLAIALAAKESLENLLGSFTIFLDKPFVIGDLINVGEVEGNVEKIGFRSTRIRTLEKSFVTVPNKKLVDTELDNLTNREIRRIKFDIALRHTTPLSTIQNIINETRVMIENDPLRFDEVSVYFYEFGNSALVVRVIYFANTAIWKDYMEMRERINYKTFEIIAKNKAEFALQTQMLVMDRTNQEAP